jgi:hypothetical protein
MFLLVLQVLVLVLVLPFKVRATRPAGQAMHRGKIHIAC